MPAPGPGLLLPGGEPGRPVRGRAPLDGKTSLGAAGHFHGAGAEGKSLQHCLNSSFLFTFLFFLNLEYYPRFRFAVGFCVCVFSSV